MSLYLVEHRLGEVADDHLALLRNALQEVTGRLSTGEDGVQIRYIRSTVIAGEGRCICLFEASSEALVRRANELAQVPIASISAAVDYEMAADAPECIGPSTTPSSEDQS